MRKNLIILIILLCLAPLNANDEYNFVQKDVDTFLSFAPDYIKLAQKYISNSQDLYLDDLFYSNSDKLLTATETFLKKYTWTYLKMNDFLYITGITLDYIAFVDVYGEVEDEESTLGDEITDDMMRLVRKNKDNLVKYFKVTDYTDYDPSYEDYTGDYDYQAETEYEEPEKQSGNTHTVEKPEAASNKIEPAKPQAPSEIVGTWYLKSDKAFEWVFNKDNTLSITQITGAAVTVGGWKGTYQIENNILTFKLDKVHPFPNKFTLKADILTADKDSLIKKK